MADAPKIDKGARVRVTEGPKEGVTGTVFWKGPNKYGPGERFGVRGDDGQTHWIDGATLALTDAEVPTGHTFDRGDRVAFKDGDGERFGTVFWTGKSRHGPGQRLGVNPDGAEGRDDAVWIDALAARPLDPADDPAPPPPRRARQPYSNDRGGSRGGFDRGGFNRGGFDGGQHDYGGADSVAEIPAEYQGNVQLDDLPPPAPWDDHAADQMAADFDESDGSAW